MQIDPILAKLLGIAGCLLLGSILIWRGRRMQSLAAASGQEATSLRFAHMGMTGRFMERVGFVLCGMSLLVLCA